MPRWHRVTGCGARHSSTTVKSSRIRPTGRLGTWCNTQVRCRQSRRQGTGTVWRDPPQAESFHREGPKAALPVRPCRKPAAGRRLRRKRMARSGRSARLRRTRGQNKAQRQRGGTDMFFIEAPPCVDVSRICPALSAVFNIDVFCIRVVTKAVETKKWLSQNALQKHFATAIFVGGRTVF